MSGAVEGVALLPCPFCGGKASIYQNTKEDGTGNYDPGFYFVRCDPCDLIHDKAWCVPYTEAVTAWNTRNTPPARSYADGVEDAAKVADAGLAQWNKIVASGGVTVAGISITEEEAHVAAGACEALSAAIHLLSQGGKA
jgi:hypothetical protein